MRAGNGRGKAIEEDKDGVRLEGTYLNGERDGDYVLKDRNGQVTERGTYRKGMRNKR